MYPLPPNPLRHLSSLLPILLGATLPFLAACPTTRQPVCPTECPKGYECIHTDTGNTCVAPRLTPHAEGSIPPGRQLRMLFVNEELVTASLSPTSGNIVIGEATSENQQHYYDIIPSNPNQSDDERALPIRGSSISLAKGARYAYITWLAKNNRFRLGSRDAKQGGGRWGFQQVTLSNNSDYRATPEFTTAERPNENFLIAYHDVDGNLALLERVTSKEGEPPTWESSIAVARQEAPFTIGCTRQGSGRNAGIGRYPSIAVDPITERVVISHFDADCGSLLISEQINGVWSTQLVDSGTKLAVPLANPGRSRVGRMSSVALSRNGTTNVAYYDETLGRLKFASKTRNGVWRTQVVDNGEEIAPDATTRLTRVGAFPSLSITEDERPVITYQDATNHRVKLARRQGLSNAWGIRTVGLPGIAGFFQDHAYTPKQSLVVGSESLDREGEIYHSRLKLAWINL